MGGVGVAGFILGGGYSWRSNQYGLAIDTVQAFELVLPNGTVTNVTSNSNPDLFFGLRVRTALRPRYLSEAQFLLLLIGWSQQLRNSIHIAVPFSSLSNSCRVLLRGLF